MVKATSIKIDHSYQRDLDEKRINNLKKAFDSGAAKAISVSLREDGAMYCYDGQHTLAMFKSQGVEMIPATIVNGNQKLEAKWFSMMNGAGSKRVSAREVHKAGKVAEVEQDVEAEKILSKFGLVVSGGGNKKNQTSAIGFIRKNVIKNKEKLIRAMTAIHMIWKDENESWSRMIVGGMLQCEESGILDKVCESAKKYKVTPRRILDYTAALQSASGTMSSGTHLVKKAIVDLCKIED
jgi:hypothetical protein